MCSPQRGRPDLPDWLFSIVHQSCKPSARLLPGDYSPTLSGETRPIKRWAIVRQPGNPAIGHLCTGRSSMQLPCGCDADRPKTRKDEPRADRPCSGGTGCPCGGRCSMQAAVRWSRAASVLPPALVPAALHGGRSLRQTMDWSRPFPALLRTATQAIRKLSHKRTLRDPAAVVTQEP